jgi:hypothetical protein
VSENDEIGRLRAMLFPYADATEISGVSWDGKYLIGDKASIKFFHEMKNRGEQIDVYKQAYDERVADKDAEIAKLRDVLDECKDYFDNRADADHDETGFVPNEEMKLLSIVRSALEKAGAW